MDNSLDLLVMLPVRFLQPAVPGAAFYLRLLANSGSRNLRAADSQLLRVNLSPVEEFHSTASNATTGDGSLRATRCRSCLPAPAAGATCR